MIASIPIPLGSNLAVPSSLSKPDARWLQPRIALLVLKRAPALWIERPETDERPLSGHTIIDKDEPSLAYGWLYFPPMRMALPLATGLAGMAALLLLIFGRAGKRR